MAPDFPAYSLGSVLRVEGVVQRSDSKRSFRLLGFSAPDFWLIYPNIDVVTETEASKQRSFLSWERGLGLVYSFRKTIVDDYGKVLPEPHASLLSGIVLGERATMPETFYTRLRETGSLHIIAVSGMNVTIIAGILINSLVLVMSRRKAIIFALLGVVFYAFLAGLSPPVVRAALMGTIAYLSMVFGRERDGLIGLSWVAAAMLLIRPFYLVDVGWQLSVAATLGIILLQAPVKRYILIPFDKIFKEDKGDWGGKESSTKHQASNLKIGRKVWNLEFGIWSFRPAMGGGGAGGDFECPNFDVTLDRVAFWDSELQFAGGECASGASGAGVDALGWSGGCLWASVAGFGPKPNLAAASRGVGGVGVFGVLCESGGSFWAMVWGSGGDPARRRGRGGADFNGFGVLLDHRLGNLADKEQIC
ncbi:MAG: ComEC/Rec2 family competence protein [Candidatus Chisholmbacteria bacterium]|nr:ComEC/Rec2 family competence protein [Candidatus Chisholmbacteria bacterium]